MDEAKLKEKYKVFEALLKKKKGEFEKISSYQQEQLESINEADLDKSELIESQTENMMREMRTESMTLDHLKKEINYLEDFKTFEAKDQVGPSTLVKTNIGNFIVAVPDHLFEVDGEKFTAISAKSPMYQALEGKKKGQKIKFNDQEIEVKEVV